MKKLITITTIIALVINVNTVSAQKIEEKDLKVNINTISNPTEQLKNIQPITFNYNTEKYKQLNLPANNQYGFLASEVQSEFPNMVSENSKVYTASKNNSKSISYNEVNTEKLIPVLVAAIKEQQAQIDLLKEELNAIRKEK